MDFSDCDISAIHPQDDLGPPSASESKSSVTDSENRDQELPDDLVDSFVEDSIQEVGFKRLLPTVYSHQSFHVGLLIRYADHDKDNWFWAVVSNVSEEQEDGTFDLY